MGGFQSSQKNSSEETYEFPQGDESTATEDEVTVSSSANTSSTQASNPPAASFQPAAQGRQSTDRMSDSKKVAIARFQAALAQPSNKPGQFELKLREEIKRTDYFRRQCNKNLSTFIKNAVIDMGMSTLLFIFFANYKKETVSPDLFCVFIEKYKLCTAHLSYEELVECWETALLSTSDLNTFTQALTLLNEHFSELFLGEGTLPDFINTLVRRIMEKALGLNEATRANQIHLYLQKFHYLKEQGWSDEAWVESEEIKALINQFTDHLLSNESLDTCIQELQAISALPKPDPQLFLDFFSFQFAGTQEGIQALFTDLETRFAPFLSFDAFIDSAMEKLLKNFSLRGMPTDEQEETTLCEKLVLLTSKKPALGAIEIYAPDLETETKETGALESSLVEMGTVNHFIERARQQREERLNQHRMLRARQAFLDRGSSSIFAPPLQNLNGVILGIPSSLPPRAPS